MGTYGYVELPYTLANHVCFVYGLLLICFLKTACLVGKYRFRHGMFVPISFHPLDDLRIILSKFCP
jgi:hypothetical protein